MRGAARLVFLGGVLAWAVTVCTAAALGVWQLRRADEKAAAQAARDGAPALLPIPHRLVEAGGFDGRPVVVRGRFVAEGTVFLDNRTRQGVSGVHVLTPLRLEWPDAVAPVERMHVLVLRGWAPRDARDRSRLPDPAVPDGLVEIHGLAQAEIGRTLELGGGRFVASSQRVWTNLDIARYATWSGLQVQPLVVRQTSELPDGLARDWPRPGDAVARHHGYAVQWFAMAAVLGGMGGWHLWRRFRTRRPGRVHRETA